ncbi:MAG: DUF3530 family protein [Cellvibrio sp.]|nr:DUF3530 family protein [Cellvibrio sp.]
MQSTKLTIFANLFLAPAKLFVIPEKLLVIPEKFFVIPAKAGIQLLILTFICSLTLSTTYAQTDPAPETKTEEATVEDTKPQEPDKKQAAKDISSTQLIADAKHREGVWLDTSQVEWLAFYKVTESKENKGVLLMIHASEKPQRWPAVLELLRRHLPLFGWETFALAIPAERLQENTTAETLTAAIDYLHQQGKFNLVFLSDNRLLHPAAQHLLPQIKPNPNDPKTIDGPLQALVLLNIQAQYPLTQELLEASFASSELPVLDVFFNPPFVTQEQDQRLHKTTAARKKLTHYRQHTFSYPEENTLDENQQFWISTVRGFLDKEAKGSELK